METTAAPVTLTESERKALSSSKGTKISRQRVGENVVMTFHEHGYTRESAQTARYDAGVAIPAGEYTLRPITIGGQETTYEKAYYFVGGGDGVLISGGYDDEKPGDARKWSMMQYGYAVRKDLDAAQESADAIARCTGSKRSYAIVTTGPVI